MVVPVSIYTCFKSRAHFIYFLKIIGLACAVLMINTTDLLYNAVHKVGLDPAYSYFGVYSIFFLFFWLLKFEKKTFHSKTFFRVHFVFWLILMFQFFNGIYHTGSSSFSIVSLFNLIGVYYLVLFFNRMKRYMLKHFLICLFLLTFLLYIVSDILSIIYIYKSQHALMSTILPFQVILLFTISILYQNKIGIVSRLWFSQIFFIAYLYCSVMFFTEDQRTQIKILFLVPMVIFGFALCLLLTRPIISGISKFKKVISGTTLPIGFFYLIVFFGSLAVYAVDRFDLFQLINRNTSGLLRFSVTADMLIEVTRTWFSMLFGLGLGTSTKTYIAYAAGNFHFLKSHSGLVSLIYENGVFLTLVLMGLVIFKIFNLKNIKNWMILQYPSKFHAYCLLTLLIFTWFIYNLIYAISIPTAVYVDQSQIYTLAAVICALRRHISA